MTTLHRLLITLLFLLALLTLATAASLTSSEASGARPPQDFGTLREQAETQVKAKSWRLALELYESVEREGLSEAEQRWLDFRLADLRWRDAAAAESADDSVISAARTALLALTAGGDERAEQRDLVWVLAHESVGDSYWRSNQWGNAWPHYEKAFAYWSSARDIEEARERYLSLVDRIVRPDWGQQDWRWVGQYSNLPRKLLENAAGIVAIEPADRSRMKFYLVQALQRDGWGWSRSERVVSLYEEIDEMGDVGPWYDDALYGFGQWLQTQGRPRATADGGFEMEQDFITALAVYEKLSAMPRDRTSHGRHAQQQIDRIRGEELSVSVPHSYLPGSLLPIQVHWRNVSSIEFLMYPVDLTDSVRTNVKDHGPYQWLGTVSLSGKSAVQRFTHDTKDDGKHAFGNAIVRAPHEGLEPGAYVLVAKAGVQTVRELVLVTDASLLLRVSESEAICWVTDAMTGEPLSGARVSWWERDRKSNDQQGDAVTDESGLVRFPLVSAEQGRGSTQLFVAARVESASQDSGGVSVRQAFATSGSPWIQRTTEKEWRFDAWTDRSTYRPGHEIQWKLLARIRDKELWTTPANAGIEFEIFDPRGTSVLEEKTTLNEFGTAIGKVQAGAEWILGEYRIELRSVQGKERKALGGATLFRLEEYKVPDFEVRVSPVPKEDGGAYRPGDRVEAHVEASLYSGGPIVNADVTVTVERKAFQMTWEERDEFGWLYDSSDGYDWSANWGWENVSSEQLKTDEEGRALVAFESPVDLSGDYEFRVTARVVDASRREVSGSGKVRVTRVGHFARVTSRKKLLAPGQEARFEFETRDQNGEALGGIEGTTTLFRLKQREVWVDPRGRRFELPGPGRVAQKTEQRETISLTRLSTATEGNDLGRAEWKIAIADEGRYVVQWRSFDERGLPVEAEATLWVASKNTKALNWTGDGVQIVVDDEAFRMGQTAPWLVTTPASGPWVLTCVEAREFLDVRVERHAGTVKLYGVDLTEQHVPNVFLSAYTTQRGKVHSDSVEILVPPVEQFLDVALQPTEESYLPGAAGKFTLTAKDHAGQPVQGEFSIAVADAALAAIQGDYAKDPRKVYYGEKRAQKITTALSLQLRQLVNLQEGEETGLRDELAFASESPFDSAALNDSMGIMGGGGGGFLAESSTAVMGKKSRARGTPASAARADLRQSEDMEVAAEAAPMGNWDQGDASGGSEGSGAGEIRVRSDFRETAVWAPRVLTDAEGRAEIELEFPDNLTRWSATAIGTTTASRFGIGRSTTKTSQPLTVRLQAPRFFVKKDICLISGLIRNSSAEALVVSPSLDIDDALSMGQMRGRQFNHGARGGRLPIEIAPGGEERVDWWVYVKGEDSTKIRVTAASANFSDAEERTYPVEAHGIETLAAITGRLESGEQGDGANALQLSLDLPAQRDLWGTKMRIQVAPSLAVTMLDALPYLIEFPYGCTEQTLSRFVPAAIVANTLKSRGLDAETAMARAFGGIEPESVAATRRGDASKRVGLDKLDEVTAAGLERLASMQHADGGWGWWSSGASDAHMTAYVVWGLSLAEEAGVDVDSGIVDRGAEFLRERLFEAENRVDLQAWMLHALGVHSQRREGRWNRHETVDLAFRNAFEKREGLQAYGVALLALAAHGLQRADEAQTLIENLRNGVKIDEAVDSSVISGQQGAGTAPARAYWGASGSWRRWSRSPIETTATALRALLAIDPDSDLIDPVSSWLIANRRAAQWSNTRDTAMCVLALNELLERSGELDRSIAYRVLLNGEEVGAVSLSPDERLTRPSVFAIPPDQVGRTDNVVEVIRTEGQDSLDVAVYAEFFTNEEPIPARGSEIFVSREYYKLVPRPTLLGGLVYDRVPLEDRGAIRSGERVEVVCTVDAKSDLEYLLFEDLKPAGFEAVQVKSGSPLVLRELKQSEVEERFGTLEQDSPGMEKRSAIRGVAGAPGFTGRSRRAHVEWRDRKVACFVDSLPQGIWQYSVTLRAEVPGQFHALPLLAEAMYVPEIRANSVESRVLVEDRD